MSQLVGLVLVSDLPPRIKPTPELVSGVVYITIATNTAKNLSHLLQPKKTEFAQIKSKPLAVPPLPTRSTQFA